MAGIKYTRVSLDLFNSKTKTGEWTMDTPPVPWNGFSAVSMCSYINSKQETVQLKVIIVNYYA